MDCDFSHDPKDVARLVEAMSTPVPSGLSNNPKNQTIKQCPDLVIGSRYVKGGSTPGWPFKRRLISRAGGIFIRTVTGMPLRDPTGGFKCWSRAALEKIDFATVASAGYSFQLEMNHRAWKEGLKIMEIPIAFTDRVAGYSKITANIAKESLKIAWRLRRGILFGCLAVAAAVGFAADAIPLPEHPRPDWMREDWVNLNGTWSFGFAADALDRTIVVPFGWGSPASGVADEGDTGWYRRQIRVPESWRGRRVFVVIGASDHDTTVSLDGRVLGTYKGGYVPFEFELTDFVKAGQDQTLDVKVWDPPAAAAQKGQWLYGKQGYGNVRGIWQTVYLEARGRRYLKSVRLTPHLATSSVSADVELDAPADEALVAEIAVAGRAEAAKVRFSKGEARKSAEIPLANPRLWTLDDPYLYDVACTLGDDRVATYFGFREFGVGKTPNGDACVTMNGKPIYLQMCLDQSYDPKGYYTFPSDARLREEIEIAKKLALSGSRVHIKVEVPRKLYWADRLGVLIQADVPCWWGEPTDEAFAEHWACFESMVARDFNHPCIYQWTLFNETWGLKTNPSIAMGLATGSSTSGPHYAERTQRTVREKYLAAKRLDPTRIIEDNSPCNRDHVETDVNTWHGYRPGCKWEETLVSWCENTFVGSEHNYKKGYRQRGDPMMNSECGNVWGYAGSTGDCDYSWDYHLMMNAFRRHLKCTGWLYTEHHDVVNEWNGYVRYDRTWKETGFEELAGMSLAGLHADASLFFEGPQGSETGRFVGRGEKVSIPVGVSFVTDRHAGRTLSLSASAWWYDGSGARRELPAFEVAGSFPARSWQCEKLWDVPFEAPAGAACGAVVLRLLVDGREIARNFWSFATAEGAERAVVPDRTEWSEGAAAVLGGLKQNGFGKGAFEFVLDAPAGGGLFVAELSAKRRNGKDRPDQDKLDGRDYMLGGGHFDRSKNPNSYPQTSVEKFPATLVVLVNGKERLRTTLADDPADSRGILSWLSQRRDRHLREAGSYGYLVTCPIAKEDVVDGRTTVRLVSDHGLAVYGERFGRYPLDPHIEGNGR